MAPAQTEQAAASPWATSEPPPSPVIFEAVLEPHRSLPAPAFRLLMILFLVQSVVRSAVFWMMGAWPCALFLAADLGIVYWAFRTSYRHARLYERIRLTPEALAIERVWPNGRRQIWQFEPYWARVELENRGAHDCRMSIVNRGKRVIIGAFLSPWQRPEIADALREALARRPRPIR